jgi:sugar phosphate isomerase/epimerase
MSTRRAFLKQAGLITSVAYVNPSLLFKKNYKLGLQLYSIRDAIAKDVRTTMKQIAGFGYQVVETYGFNKGYWGLDAKTAKQILDDNNLTTPSGHYDFDKYLLNNATEDVIKRYVDEIIEGAHVLKQDYIVWPWLDPSLRSIDKFKLVAATLNKIGEQISKAGLQLAYHNHDFEFTEQNGQIGYDIILNETDTSLVKLEMDIYWVAFASKLKPHEWFEKQPGRFVLWHIKDMDKATRDYEVMGEGSIDFTTIMPDTKLAGAKHIYVEQGGNFKPDSMSCVKRSAKYVKNVLYK